MESALYAKHVLATVKVGDDEIRAAYDRQKATLVVPEKRRVAHIAVGTEAEAKTLLARVRKGEDFADLLEAHTLDKPSIKTGGDLGWIEKGKVSETYDELFRVPRGGVASPIRSDNAWHLVRVLEIEPQRALTFDEAKERLAKTILEKKKHDAREAWIAKLRKAGEIAIDDKAIKAFVAANPFEAP